MGLTPKPVLLRGQARFVNADMPKIHEKTVRFPYGIMIPQCNPVPLRPPTSKLRKILQNVRHDRPRRPLGQSGAAFERRFRLPAAAWLSRCRHQSGSCRADDPRRAGLCAARRRALSRSIWSMFSAIRRPPAMWWTRLWRCAAAESHLDAAWRRQRGRRGKGARSWCRSGDGPLPEDRDRAARHSAALMLCRCL